MPGRQNINSYCLALLLLLVSVAVSADQKTHYDRINLSVTAGQEIDNDTLIAVLSAREEGEDQAALANAVNRTIKQAVEQSKQAPDIEVRTLSYQTQPRYQKQRLIGWLVRQSMQLKSGNIRELSQLLGKLQDDLAIDSLHYTVSPPQREKMEQILIKQAIERFKRRAENVTRQLGRKKYRLVKMDINTQEQTGQPMQMRSLSVAQEREAAAPQLEPGTQTLRVTVEATIELAVK
ncbi:MAG: SIMPL domain-containing protein [Thiohalophilus sp.]